MPALIRAFVAIELPAPVLASLTLLQSRLRPRAERAARWVSTQGIHLTLKFLGDIPLSSIPGITQAMAKAAAKTSPLSLGLSGAGCFPDLQRPRVVWIGLGGDLSALAGLQRAMETELAVVGCAREDRPFTPHLTLARLRDSATPLERLAISDGVRTLAVPPSAFTVDKVLLIRSDLRPDGATYTRLSAVPLQPLDSAACP